MAVCEIRLSNQNVLNKMTSFTAILPERKPGPFPVFYLLHGLSDDHTAWVRRTSIERYVENLPLIVVMPDGERSFYTDSLTNPRAAFETMIVRDLIGVVDNTFQTVANRTGRAIAGLSMGGYGALKLALKYPDLYCAAASHSGATAFASRPFHHPEDEDWSREWTPVFGENPQGGTEDLFALAERVRRDKLPGLRIDCGVDDFLIEDNRAFHRHLEALDIPHEYAEYPGEHSWAYWDVHIQETIAFFADQLNLVS